MNTPPKINSPSSKFDIMSHNTAIDAALADLESQDIINYAETARSYGVNRITLMNRYKGKSTSRHEAQAQTNMALTPSQEEVLVDYILKLTARGTPPSPYIVKNMAEELAKKELGKH